MTPERKSELRVLSAGNADLASELSEALDALDAAEGQRDDLRDVLAVSNERWAATANTLKIVTEQRDRLLATRSALEFAEGNMESEADVPIIQEAIAVFDAVLREVGR